MEFFGDSSGYERQMLPKRPIPWSYFPIPLKEISLLTCLVRCVVFHCKIFKVMSSLSVHESAARSGVDADANPERIYLLIQFEPLRALTESGIYKLEPEL